MSPLIIKPSLEMGQKISYARHLKHTYSPIRGKVIGYKYNNAEERLEYEIKWDEGGVSPYFYPRNMLTVEKT